VKIKKTRDTLCLALAFCLPAGCGAPQAPGPAEAGGEAPAVAAEAAPDASAPLPLKVSLNQVMVAMVDFAADGIWRPAASETPLTDRQWLYVQQDATNLVASASLMTSVGTGVNDAVWVEDPDWRRWSEEVQILALQALDAAGERDQARLAATGDRLVEVCEACHRAFKPGLPSMGVTRFPVYPKREG